MYICLHVKYPLFFLDLLRLGFSQRSFEKYSNTNFTKIRSVAAKLFHADGRTAMTKPAVVFRSFANAPKSEKQ
jgi:hypothetical protein